MPSVLFLFLSVLVVSLKDTINVVTAFGASLSNMKPDKAGVRLQPGTFAGAECLSIVGLMKALPVQYDDRADKSVKRTNYFETKNNLTNQKYKWIFERIVPAGVPLNTFISSIDFLLLHEFEITGFFDWHVDTKPGDGTGRTNNINVMLSKSADYKGGILTVGSSSIDAQQGDLYSYPASFPHKVSDITGGKRHTLVLAMCDATRNGQEDLEYWTEAEVNHEMLCQEYPSEPKLHMLHGEFLAALGRPDSEIDGKFADMYACTTEALQYAQSFEREGQELISLGNLEESKGHLRMATMIQERLKV